MVNEMVGERPTFAPGRPAGPPRLIGLAGFARVGKDTIGAQLVEEYGFQRRAFADKLKELAMLIDPEIATLVKRFGWEWVKTDYPPVRDFLVALGTGARRIFGPDVWLDAALPLEPWGLKWMRAATVVTDVRYRNEGERIRNMGGEVWLVSRPEYGAANFEERQSLSEVTYDRLILNDGGLDDLAATIRKEMAV